MWSRARRGDGHDLLGFMAPTSRATEIPKADGVWAVLWLKNLAKLVGSEKPGWAEMAAAWRSPIDESPGAQES